MEKRKSKLKKDEEENVTPTKEEYAVSKYLRFTAPSKKANMFGSKVQYFVASKAVDALLASKWATGQSKNNPLFSTRESCEAYLNILLQKNIFHRVRKFVKVLEVAEKATKKPKTITKADSNKKSLTNEGEQDIGSKGELRRRKKGAQKDSDNEDISLQTPLSESEKSKKSKKDNNDSNKSATDEKEKVQGGDREKKKDKKKVKLELHETQVFIDGPEQFYVWVYDPVPLKTWILGFFIVIGAIVICLFPLWPPQMRTGVYYLSLAGAGFLGLILSLAIVRYIVYGVMWVLTLGRHQLWLLPNLLEDVGFVESFIPVYTYKYVGSGDSKSSLKRADKNKKKGGRNSKTNTEAEEEKLITTKGDELKTVGQGVKAQTGESVSGEGAKETIEEGGEFEETVSLLHQNGSSSKSSTPKNGSSSKSSTPKNGGDDFEIVDGEKL